MKGTHLQRNLLWDLRYALITLVCHQHFLLSSSREACLSSGGDLGEGGIIGETGAWYRLKEQVVR